MMIKLDVIALVVFSGSPLTQEVAQLSMPLPSETAQMTLLVLSNISETVSIAQVVMTMQIR